MTDKMQVIAQIDEADIGALSRRRRSISRLMRSPDRRFAGDRRNPLDLQAAVV
jgi:hypothetical protein